VEGIGKQRTKATRCGDLNIDLKSADGAEFITFMRNNLKLELNNDPAISTTRSITCIDGVFTRHVEHLQTINFILYFSHHKPLLSITAQAIYDTCNDVPVQ
jgi:hypothetical protein